MKTKDRKIFPQDAKEAATETASSAALRCTIKTMTTFRNACQSEASAAAESTGTASLAELRCNLATKTEDWKTFPLEVQEAATLTRTV